jgi:branched-chain amino acid transport system permease protein
MIFISVIGGIGYVEGPIVGAIVFFAAQVIFADYGSWYLVLLGALAVAGAVWLPGGLWGAVRERTGAQLFPLGYRVTEIVTTSGKSLPQDGSETTTSRTL